MMHPRDIAIWALLVTFVAGGAAGPAVHQLQHATNQTAASDTACHTEAVHGATGPAWGEEQADLHLPDCAICATRLLVVSPMPAPTPTPDVSTTSRVAPLSHVVAAQTTTDRFIRGPPPPLEGRLG